MNRPGQPQQRPPILAPTPNLGGPFRQPFPNYPLPPRNLNAMQTAYVQGLPQPGHRTPGQPTQNQSLVQQQTSAFMQQRGQSVFGFNTGLGQAQQQSSTLQQPQTNGSSSLPPHLAQTPNLGNSQTASSTADLGLDPNDFPALGSSSVQNGNSSSQHATGAAASYATQAGTGSGGTSTVAGQGRDFTQDDFPALGGQQTQAQNSTNAENHSHPPGFNGFSNNDPARPSMLAGSQTPGLLNLTPSQARSVHPGFGQAQSEAEKQQQRNYSLKLNQSQAAWNSPNANSTAETQPAPSNQPNGAQSSQNPVSHPSAPPGVSRPFPQQQSQQTFAPNGLESQGNAPNPSNDLLASNLLSSIPPPNSAHLQQQHPQTPAQQVLVSAADRWGLLQLLSMIQSAPSEVDHGLTTMGTDLGTMGLDMGYPGKLYSTFITPWADQSAAHSIEPDFHLPACYAVNPPPPGPAKVSTFNDETLLFIFYSSPRDALQEIAAQELYNRNWRFHKELRLWITKESGNSASAKIHGGEQGTYAVWDPENWSRERREIAVLYSDLEDKTTPAFLPGTHAGPNPQQSRAGFAATA